MSKIENFTFYKNYYEIIKHLDAEDRLEMYEAIIKYMFEDEEPKLSGLKEGIWINIKMPLNTSKNNVINGKKGGAPKGNKNANKASNFKGKKENKTTQKQPKNNPKTTEGTTEKQANNISTFYFLISNFYFNDNINKLLEEYINIRIKNKYTITENIINRLCNKLIEYSTNDEEKEEIILNAINGAWKDFYPLKKEEANKNSGYKKNSLERFNDILDSIPDD